MAEKNKEIVIGIVLLALIVIVVAMISRAPSTETASSTNPTPLPAKVIPNNNGTKIVIPAQPAPSVAGKGPLDGHKYVITAYNANTLPAGENYTVSFATGRVTAHICNTIVGPYNAAYGSMTATLVTTVMACTSPADIMQVEQIFGTVFKNSMTYTSTPTGLTVSGGGNTVFLTEVK